MIDSHTLAYTFDRLSHPLIRRRTATMRISNVLAALFSALVLSVGLTISNAVAWGVCVDFDPRAPRCDDAPSEATDGPGTSIPTIPIKTPRNYATEAYRTCRAHFLAKNMDAALEACRTAIGHDPSFALPYNLLAGIYNEWNDFPHAIDMLRAAIARENNPDFLKNLSLILENWAWFALRANDLVAAEMAARSILANEFNHANALYIMGVVRERRQDVWGAIEYYDRSRPAEAQRLRDEIARQNRIEENARRQAQVNELRTTADFEYASGELDRAEQTLKSLLEIDPNNEDAWLRLGKVLAAQSRLDDAAAVYRKLGALGAGADWASGMIYNLYWTDAEARANTASTEDKISIWTEFGERYPDQQGNSARWRLAKIYHDNDKFDRLVKVAEAILRADPDDADALRLIKNTKTNIIRSSAEAAFNNGDEDRAVAYLKGEVEKNPASVSAAADLAFYLVRDGHREDALSVMQKAVASNPDSGYAHYILAWAARSTNDDELIRYHISEPNRLSDNKYADFENETLGPLGTVMSGIGTILTPLTTVRNMVASGYQRAKPITKDWSQGIRSVAGSLFSGSNPQESKKAASAAKFFGSMALHAGDEDARKFSSLVFDSGALVPSDGLTGAQSIIGSVAVDDAFEPIAEDPPAALTNTDDWKETEVEISVLESKSVELHRQISHLEENYDQATSLEQRADVAVKIVEIKQEKSNTSATIAFKKSVQRERARKFHFDTTIKARSPAEEQVKKE